jgi:hypothetical protein
MTTAERVRKYLSSRPYILEALESGIVNLSELSRRLQEELEVGSAHAVKASLRRYSEQLRTIRAQREERVLHILRQSTITILDSVTIMISNTDADIKSKAKVQVNSHYVILVTGRESFKGKIRTSHLLRVHENCTAIIVSSSEEIERTPGVVAFITTLLSEQNINALEFISCFTETIIVVERKDSLRSYELLSRIIGQVK